MTIPNGYSIPNPTQVPVSNQSIKPIEAMDLKTVYTPESINSTQTILLMGEPGYGKTSLIASGPKPILNYSFDPKGTAVIMNKYPELISSKKYQFIPFWNERADNPTEYNRWESIWKAHIASGYLDQFAIVTIDSLTTWLEAAVNEWIKQKNIQRKGKILDNLAQGDYPGLYNLVRSMIKQTAACDCHFALTAHLEPEQDELLGTIRYVLSTYKKLKVIIPALFTEKWVITKQPGSNGITYSILTNNEGLYSASTQLKLPAKLPLANTDRLPEGTTPENLRDILKKAGVHYEDKPNFWE